MGANDMDDMFLQCNKNAIYVLNSSYAYGEFGRLNLFGTPSTNVQATPRSHSGCFPRESFCRNSSLSNANNTIKGLVGGSARTSVPTSTSATKTKSSPSTTAVPKLFHYTTNHHYYDEKLQPYQFSSHHHQHYQQHLQQSLHQQHPNFIKYKTNSSTMTTKKNSAVKSAIIAKKTKFWKYLEEEKWKKNSIENLSTTNCERDSGGNLVKNTNTTTTTNKNNHNNNNINNNNNNTSRSKNVDNQKSSTELYREAAQLLGLSCTLCDNCRCLDCQSRYFECDDSDSYSEISFMGEYYEAAMAQHPQFEEQNSGSDSNCGQSSACRRTNELSNCESLSDLSIDDAESSVRRSDQ